MRSTVPLCSVTLTLLGAWSGVYGAPPTTITPNGLGTSVLPPNAGIYNITGGTTAGSNLFHSFSTFNLGTGNTADFNVTSGIANILARVTGGPSTIDGTITSTIGAGGPVSSANLFFINPAGVLFTANAQVNLGGSFIVSTASYVKFADGSYFYGDVSHPIQDAGLSSAPVSAFGFLSAQPAAVQFEGSLLSVNPYQGLHVIAGNISLNYTELDAPSGNLTLFSAASAGEVPFSLASPGTGYAGATNTSYGNISIINGSYADIDGAGGGHVVIRGGKLTVDNSTISSANGGSVAGGDISVQANQVAVQDGGSIQSTAAAAGNAGNISFQIGSLTVDGTNAAEGYETGIFSFSLTGATGGAGAVDVAASGPVSLMAGGQIGTSTASTGGNVSVQADSLSIDGVGTTGQLSEISTSSYNPNAGAGGLISITVTNGVSLTNGGEIASFADSAGDGAAIQMTAGSLGIDDSGIQTTAAAAGNAGAIALGINGTLALSNEGVISSATSGSGAAGNINVQALSAGLSGESNIASYSAPSGNVPNTGNSGAISVTITQALSIDGGSLIGNSTGSLGNAGTIFVQAGSLSIVGVGSTSLATGISDQTFTGATGNAGAVTIDVAGELTIQNSGSINSSTFSSGSGGNLLVNAGSLDIDGSGAASGFTGISTNSETGATGNGASLTVNVAGAATITGDGEISITTFSSGNAGQLAVNVGGALTVTNGGEINGGTFSVGTSGEVFVHAGSLFIASEGNTSDQTGISDQSGTGATGNAGPLTVDVDNALVITDGGEISSGTHSTGNGGNVTVQAGTLTIEDAATVSELTGISSETDGTTNTQGNPTGQGGNAGSVDVAVSGSLLITGGEIDTNTFCSGNAGNVTVQAGSLSIDGSTDPGRITGIFSNSTGYTGDVAGLGGNAGTVMVGVGGELSLTGQGKIGAATLTTGQGGGVDIQAGKVVIDGAASGITAQAVGLGNGGSITLNAGSVALTNGALITASSLESNAGTIVINASSSLTLRGYSLISTEAEANGGDITLNVGGLVYLLDSGIAASAGNNGGNILIDPQFVVLDDSVISANAALGQGGNITIITGDYLTNDSLITATGATDGTITISSPVLDLSGDLLALPAVLVSQEDRLRETCARSVKHEFSTFIVVGRGGTELPPDELQPDFGLTALPTSSSEPNFSR